MPPPNAVALEWPSACADVAWTITSPVTFTVVLAPTNASTVGLTVLSASVPPNEAMPPVPQSADELADDASNEVMVRAAGLPLLSPTVALWSTYARVDRPTDALAVSTATPTAPAAPPCAPASDSLVWFAVRETTVPAPSSLAPVAMKARLEPLTIEVAVDR